MIDHYDKINEKIASETAIGDSIEDLENNKPIDPTPRDIRLCGHRFAHTDGYLGNIILLRGDANSHIPPNVLMVGPHWRIMFVTIVIITAINFIIIGVSSTSKSIVFGIIGWLLCMITYLLVGCSNPGYIYNNMTEEEAKKRFPHKNLHKCMHCNAYVPPQSFHCTFCNLCVEKLDHHCPWVGKCIGKYNLYFFHAFLGFLLLNVVMLFLTVILMPHI